MLTLDSNSELFLSQLAEWQCNFQWSDCNSNKSMCTEKKDENACLFLTQGWIKDDRNMREEYFRKC